MGRCCAMLLSVFLNVGKSQGIMMWVNGLNQYSMSSTYNLTKETYFKFQVVQNPIDLLKIQQKLKTEEYDDVEDMQQDIELLVNNAKSFYKVWSILFVFTYAICNTYFNFIEEFSRIQGR